MEFVNGLNGLEKVFAVCALLGGTLFIIRLVLQFMGLHDHDAGAGVDASSMDAGHAPGLADSDISFKLLSLQGVTAFLLMFGLVGLAMSKQSGAGPFLSVVVAAAAAFVTVRLLARFFAYMTRLQSSGNINPNDSVGLQGTVYLNIPSEGTGQVEVVVQNRMRIYDASSADKTPLKTGDKIRVKAVVAGNTLIVEKI